MNGVLNSTRQISCFTIFPPKTFEPFQQPLVQLNRRWWSKRAYWPIIEKWTALDINVSHRIISEVRAKRKSSTGRAVSGAHHVYAPETFQSNPLRTCALFHPSSRHATNESNDTPVLGLKALWHHHLKVPNVNQASLSKICPDSNKCFAHVLSIKIKTDKPPQTLL